MLKPFLTEWCLRQTSQSGHFSDSVSQHRSVCDLSQQQTSNVCVTYSRQQSSGNRSTINELGSYPRICISPIHVIPAILNKICLFQCRIVLVAPLWFQRSWFPGLLQLLVAPPLRLPNVPDLLGQLEGDLCIKTLKCLFFTSGYYQAINHW